VWPIDAIYDVAGTKERRWFIIHTLCEICCYIHINGFCQWTVIIDRHGCQITIVRAATDSQPDMQPCKWRVKIALIHWLTWQVGHYIRRADSHGVSMVVYSTTVRRRVVVCIMCDKFRRLVFHASVAPSKLADMRSNALPASMQSLWNGGVTNTCSACMTADVSLHACIAHNVHGMRHNVMHLCLYLHSPTNMV